MVLIKKLQKKIYPKASADKKVSTFNTFNTMNTMSKRKMMKEIGEVMIKEQNTYIATFQKIIEDNDSSDERDYGDAAQATGIKSLELNIRRLKIQKLIIKEIYIENNSTLRKCLRTKHLESMNDVMESVEKSVVDNMYEEQDYIELCDFFKKTSRQFESAAEMNTSLDNIDDSVVRHYRFMVLDIPYPTWAVK